MEQAKHADHEEDLEEGDKDVGARGGEQRQGENRRKTTVHDGRRNVLHDVDDALVACAPTIEEAVHDVRAEVDAEADADDEDGHGGDVDSEAPPVHETYTN